MNDSRIHTVDAWEALDSRGTPTVACEITLYDGSRGQATVPSGASTGRHEAHELRDGGTRYSGRGVRAAVTNIRAELADAVHGLPASEQRRVDEVLQEADNTDGFSRLGANATLAISLAAALAGAASAGHPLWRSLTDAPLLPLPMINIVSGGAHAGGLIDIQDVLAVPVGASCFGEALEWVVRVRRHTAIIAAAAGLPSALVADEGGIAGPLPSNRAALELLMRGIEASGLTPGDDVGIAVDIAATQLLRADGSYEFSTEQRVLTGAELVEELAGWVENFPLLSIEDALAEDDWQGWRRATDVLGEIQLMGDDLFTTNPHRLQRGIAEHTANAVLIKVNQNGTLTGAADVARLAHEAGYNTVVSARSGDTEDSWLADLAVGWQAAQIKVGSTTRSERTAKWNRLLQLEHQLGDQARYAGAQGIRADPKLVHQRDHHTRTKETRA